MKCNALLIVVEDGDGVCGGQSAADGILTLYTVIISGRSSSNQQVPWCAKSGRGGSSRRGDDHHSGNITAVVCLRLLLGTCCSCGGEE